MSSRSNAALAPEWHGDADALACEAKREELKNDPDLLLHLQRWASRELDHAIEAAAENMYAAEADNGDEY
jgi:hypothetical protein